MLFRSPFRNALKFGTDVVANATSLMSSGAAKPSVSALEIAALFRHAETIPGMCDHEKIKALCDIFRHSRAGDVVEIGSWWGKSAFVLSRLAAYYDVGKLLCVDPWSKEHLSQRDEKGLLDRVTVNANEALTVFLLNLLPYANGRVNYLRLPSVDAAAEYRLKRNVVSEVFGTTAYSARIAVLHVDGNHNYESARSDVEAWAGLMVPGGWLIIDDYVWPYGDGPQRVGDEFLDRRRDSISCAFVQGSALFIQVE